MIVSFLERPLRTTRFFVYQTKCRINHGAKGDPTKITTDQLKVTFCLEEKTNNHT